jgi:hypothetical protein
MKTKLIFAAIFCFVLTTVFLLLMGAAVGSPFLGISVHGYGLNAGLWFVIGMGCAMASAEVQ